MNGNALLIVPSQQRETDAWMAPAPGAVAGYYNETQIAPAFAELTKMMRAYTQADTFNFSSAARQLQDNLRALSPSIYPQTRQLRLEYFYNHFEGFYRAIWCYGIALVILIVAHRSCAYHNTELRGFRARNGFRAHFALAICTKSSSRARGCPNAFLALSRASAGRPVARSRNDSRRCLGKLFLGQVLGLGSKRDMGIDCVALLHTGLARPAGGLVDAVRPRSCERGLFPRRVNGVVWRELCPRKRSA